MNATKQICRAVAKVVLALLIVIAVMYVGPARSAEEHVTVNVWKIDNYTSNPGEDKLAFVRRVGAELQAWTTDTGLEGCGMFGANDQGYTITLYTMHSQVVCAEGRAVAEGYTSTGETIHSHPTVPSHQISLTAADRAALKQVHMYALASMSVRTLPVEQFHFSMDDFASGAGYLVLNNRLLYQHGAGTEVELTLKSDIAQVTP